MAAVAVYVNGVKDGGKLMWTFEAPEVQHQSSGSVEDAEAGAIVGIYQGLFEALRWARGMGYVNVLVHSSDEIFIAQMLEGVYAQSDQIQQLWWEVKQLEQEFYRVSYFLHEEAGSPQASDPNGR